MGVAEIIEAIPVSTSTDKPDRDKLRKELVAGVVGFIPTSATRSSIDPSDSATGAVRNAYVLEDVGTFVYTPTNTTDEDDGLTVIVLAGDRRYELVSDMKIKPVVESRTAEAEPSDPDFGQQWIDETGVWGSANSIQTWTALEGGSWVETAADYGAPIYVKDEKGFVHWDGDSWEEGFGSTSYADASIPVSALIGLAASFTLKAVNQTTYAPPGSRVTGATATVPLGGTAASINDDSTTTTSTTNALGDLTSDDIGDRIVARLTWSTAVDLIAIDVKDIKASASGKVGIYTSTDGGDSWTQAGADFSLTTSKQHLLRTGTFDNVTDVAVVAEAKSWSTATITIGDLNAHDDTVTVTKGTGYIVASDGFGVFAGKSGQYALAEKANTFTFYSPAPGDRIYDQDLTHDVRWNGTAWISAAGAWINFQPSDFTPASESTVSNGGGTSYSYTPSNAPNSVTHSGVTLSHSVKYTARRTGAKLRFHLRCGATTTAGNATIALLRDSESNAVDYMPTILANADSTDTFYADYTFVIDALDTDEHTYKIGVFYSTGGGRMTAENRMHLDVEEAA